jgi:UDPglucose--hexose-1-phosphate uridylyltransferase
MHEMRQDFITKQWVLFSTERGKRPNDFHTGTVKGAAVPPYDEKCPFCPGNEHLLPPIVCERRVPNAEHKSIPWQTRVVPNKFPIVSPAAGRATRNIGNYRISGGYGVHEVVIESPFHDRDIPGTSEMELDAVVNAYLDRYDELKKRDPGLEVYIFRNHGAGSGTSLVHPHSQIIAIPALSDKRRRLVYEAGRYYEEEGGCVFCEVLNFEKKRKIRVLYENDCFLCIIPFAAQVPFELWVMPKHHKSSFNDIEEIEITAFSDALRFVLRRLYHRLDDPDYNYIIQSFSADGSGGRALHWYLQILPRSTIPAGFELASGMSVNPFLPEENCEFLKE